MSLLGNVVGHGLAAVGRAEDYLTPGAGSGSLTDTGRAIYSPNSTLAYPGAINPFKQGSAFKYSPVTGGGNAPAPVQPIDMTLNGGVTQPAGNFTQAAGGAGTGAPDNSADLASLDAQERMLREFLGSAGNKYNQGITGINDEFGRLTGRAAEQNSRAQRDYAIKEEDTTRAKTDALGRVDTNANVLANSLRQRIGRASGSGSSAYQVTAPGAVAREASNDRSNVLENYGANFRDLGIAKKDTESDYNNLLSDYTTKKNDATRNFRQGYEEQLQGAEGNLGDIAAQRRALQGGGVGAINAARAPYDAQVSARNQTIDSLFNQYRNPFQARDVQAAAPNLRDYVTDGSQVTQQQQQAGTAASASPYARFLQPDNDKDKLF
jgi:hypothetical protein